MMFRTCGVALLQGLLLLLSVRPAGAADQAEVLKKIESINSKALEAYKAGKPEDARSQLLEAVVLAKESGLGTHAATGQTYLNLGVVYLAGLHDSARGARHFEMALKLDPSISLPPALATQEVTRVFEQARKPGQAPPPAEATPVKPAEAAPVAPAAPPAKGTADLEKELTLVKEQARKDGERHDKLQKELALAQESARKERAEKEKLLDEKKKRDERDKTSADQSTKARLEADKLLAEVRGKTLEKEKLLSAALEREKKERDQKQNLEKAKLEVEKAKLEIEKAKLEVEKQLSATREKEKQERGAKEAALKEKLALASAEKTREERDNRDRLARERIALGPDLPARISQPLFCSTQDDVPAGTDTYVHCAPQPGVVATTIALYYRPAGVLHYNSLTMERSKKGWFSAQIPGSRVTGKWLQYYAEALGERHEVLATNGKNNSPNILPLAPAGAASSRGTEIAAAAPAGSPEDDRPAKAAPVSRHSRRKPRR